MKIRNGFVSNSSTSSFICDFCGANEAGYGLSLDEAGMQICENGHTFCIDDMEKDFEPESINGFKYALKLINEDKFYLWFRAADRDADLHKKCEDEFTKILTGCIENNTCTYDYIRDLCQESELEPLHDFIFEDSFHDTILDHGIPAEFCPVCRRKKEMEKDSEYQKYVDLYEHFNKVVPDGSSR